jgi:hypothetical protein
MAAVVSVLMAAVVSGELALFGDVVCFVMHSHSNGT